MVSVVTNTLPNRQNNGFTLIELLVVMAIISLLLTIAAPRYFAHLDRAREAALRESLSVMRESIDKFQSDTGKYPENLDELVSRHYLRKVPPDPITESTTSWIIVPPQPPATGSVYDVRSSAKGNGSNGSPYSEW